jgi:hypothetical protein
MHVSSATQSALQHYQLAARQDDRQRPSEALVESIKSGVKQQDRSLGEEGARMVASDVAARHIDVRV